MEEMPLLEYYIIAPPPKLREDNRTASKIITVSAEVRGREDTFVNMRRKSFDINDDPRTISMISGAQPQAGCMTRLFGFFGRKN
jgi:hypothetical protein